MPRIWTIGYEKLLPLELAAELEANGIERLLDVRIRPQSRRAGMSKTRLGELLAEQAIHDAADILAEVGADGERGEVDEQKPPRRNRIDEITDGHWNKHVVRTLQGKARNRQLRKIVPAV